MFYVNDGLVPSRHGDGEPAQSTDDAVLLRWLGVAGLVLSHRGRTLAIDPFVTRPGMRYLLFGRPSADVGLAASTVPVCDAILVSHAHHDHCMDVPTIARRTGATVLGSRNTCLLVGRLGVSDRQLRRIEPGDSEQLPPFGITVWPGDHPTVPGFGPGALSRREVLPPRLRDYRMDTCLSFLVHVAGLAVYVCNARRLTSAPRADVLCVGAAHSDAFYRTLLTMVRPRLVIPMHWDDLFKPLGEPLRPFWAPPSRRHGLLRRLDPQRFAANVERLGTGRVLSPEPMHEYDVTRLLAN
jgi:L-ascorbate metabolism protein UlaG (beta-lactamase superfamily)